MAQAAHRLAHERAGRILLPSFPFCRVPTPTLALGQDIDLLDVWCCGRRFWGVRI
jgi:hypothetical protein